jgi:CxxC motif-containing protein (DUF1111 family)
MSMKTSLKVVIALFAIIGMSHSAMAQTNLSLGKVSDASSVQGTSVAANANDSSATTRWTAIDGTFPQWWRVDLGSAQDISRVDIKWYSSATRSYKYKIEVSDDNVNYTTPVDKSTNTTLGDTSDSFSDNARYVRVTLNGASAGFASAYDISVFGASGPVPVITSATTKSGTVGTALSYQITATNAPTSYSSSTLPAGLSLNSTTGLISGTPTASGTPSATITATNANGSGSATLTFNIAPASTPPVITSPTTATGTVGAAFTYQISATNNPTSFNATGLPAGLTVNTSTGLISGTPTAAATTNITISATNSSGTDSATVALTVSAASGGGNLALNQPSTASSAQGTSVAGAANDSSATTRWTAADGTFPQWWRVDLGSSQSLARVDIKWYSSASRSYKYKIETSPDDLAYTMKVDKTANTTLGDTSDAFSATARYVRVTVTGSSTGFASAFDIAVFGPGGGVPVITSATTKSGTVGTALTYQITATNSPTGFNATSLPPGLSVNTTTGAITGTPTTSGTFNATVSAVNAGGTGTGPVAFTIAPTGGAAPVITSAGTSSAVVNSPASYQIFATNAPTVYGATGLPPGMTINTANGVISGTPTAVGVYTVVISATNASGTTTKNVTYTITAVTPVPKITSALNVTGTVGTALTYQITATNSPTSYSASPLPGGLTVDTATGIISGTPTGVTVANTSISATNANGFGGELLVFDIGPATPAAPVINSATSLTCTLGSSLGYQMTASNKPTSFSATGLPAGMSINTATGYISGTPTAVGSTTAVISSTNSTGTSPTKNLVINVTAAVIPAVPTRLAAIPVSTSQVNLTWNPVNGATGYDIQRDGVTVASVTSPNTHTGLAASSTHTYAIRAKNTAGTSAFSPTVSAVTEAAVGSIVPLFNSGNTLEVDWVTDTPTAIITHFGDRARDRHGRESEFHAYDHYLTWYWEQRTANIEIIDRVAKGGSEVIVNFTTQWPLNAPEFRALFRGINTKAEYFSNISATRIDPYNYTARVSTNPKEGRALQVGDRFEIEVSQFLATPTHGRQNYYGTAVLYVVGQGGMVPWEGQGTTLDSFPLDETAWMGGRTTLPYQNSNEPEDRFKETAGNISWTSIQPFMLGRRLHHTDFGDGSHLEAGNPIFPEQVGKLGPRYTGRSCFACHTENGRALAPATGAMMTKSVTRVGSDAAGASHPDLGNVLQPIITSGTPEGGASIASYTTTNGTYGDGTAYTLRKPVYAFTGVVPSFYSVRLAPQLVGLGLLEAIPEGEIAALADPSDTNGDGISGKMQTVTDPQTGQIRLGRFGYKAGQASLKHQVASALNNDMGVTTSIFPNLDRGANQANPGASTELADADLDLLYRYNATLGVAARRDLTDAQALQGEALFATANCVKCHTTTMTTSAYHPLAELRSQTIHPYTDLLLHDMGTGLADNMGEANASGAEWRTAPLWSIGLTAGVSGGENYLHDGRAQTLEEAILWHGGEAQASREAFRTMSAANRAALIKFLQSL